MIRTITTLILSLFLFQPVSLPAADTSASKTPELSKEERLKQADHIEKMADVHKLMAECLRSDKPMSECREQMLKDCPMAKSGECPMMDGMGMMHGHGHGHGRGRSQGQEKTKATKSDTKAGSKQ